MPARFQLLSSQLQINLRFAGPSHSPEQQATPRRHRRELSLHQLLFLREGAGRLKSNRPGLAER